MVLFRMRNVTDKSFRENKTHILCSITFLKNQAIYVIMCKNIVYLGRPQIAVRYMCTACWIPEATNIHSQYVILLFHRSCGCMETPQFYVLHSRLKQKTLIIKRRLFSFSRPTFYSCSHTNLEVTTCPTYW
jgi:hypothetical protein